MPERTDERSGKAHDVLAAEEFPMPAPDPELHDEAAHDVLAAEEFGVPAPDPAMHHGPVELPPDLTGSDEPHEVLAAEEFAMPAGPASAFGRGGLRGRAGSRAGLVPVVALGWIVLSALRRRRRRRRSG